MTILNVLVIGRKGIGKSTFIDIHTNDDGTYNDMSVSTIDGASYCVKYHEYELEHSTDQYQDKDLLLFCFAVNDVDSYKQLEKEYVEEAVRLAKGVPMLAVGTKCDLRDDPEREDMVSIEQAVQLSRKVGATAYLECSTTANFNLDALQEEIVKIILHARNVKNDKTSNFSFGIVKFLLGR